MAVQEGLTSIRVSWSPPTSLGDTTGYRIYYSGGSSGSVDVSDGSTDNYTLTGLQNGESYTISIVATSKHLPSESVTVMNIDLGISLFIKSKVINPQRTCAARVTVVVHSVCLLSHISPLEHLFILKILSCTQQVTEVKKNSGFFSDALSNTHVDRVVNDVVVYKFWCIIILIAHCVGRSKEPVGTVYVLECILYKNMHLYLPL